MRLFDLFLFAHIATGATGLATFWVPVLTRKGAPDHRKWGRIFALCMLATGFSASGMSCLTILDPGSNHHGIANLAMVSAFFGWMMLYLSILTVSLAWHGLETIRLKADHKGHRNAVNLGLQGLTIAAALNCFARGALMGEPLLMGVAVIGVASGATNLSFIAKDAPGRSDYVKEHVKASVGAGISVYTAFLAFGAARIMPHHAFNPVLWAAPVVVGVAIILYHWRRIDRNEARRPAPQA